MLRQNREISWNQVQENELGDWYMVSKVMGTILTGGFPYFTFAELITQMRQDPEFNAKEEDG